MPLKLEQIDAFFKAVNDRTPPAPLARPSTPAQRAYVDAQLAAAFESIGIHTVSEPALKAALASDSHLYTLRERALYVPPADLFSRRFFRFRGRLPLLHATLVRLFTDAAGSGEHKIRIWNPFCGFGGDTYSLAALARLAQTTTGAAVRTIEVIGSDILPSALQYASTGRYEFRRSEWQEHRARLIELFGEESVADVEDLPISTRHLPPGVETFFSTARLPDGGYAITPDESLRRITAFRTVNLFRIAEIGQLGGFDLVVTCSRAAVADSPAVEKYRAAMTCAIRPGGYLILPDAPAPPPPPPTLSPVKPKASPSNLELVEPGLYCRVR